MNIIFLTRFDPKDINNWSGTLFFIYNKLREKHVIQIIGPEILKQIQLFSEGNFSANTFIPSDRYVKNLGLLLTERINEFNFDLVFFGDLLFNPTGIDIPYIILSDMTYEQVKIFYMRPDARNIEPCIDLEKSLLEKSYRIIFSSEWIKKKAIEFYSVNPEKISVVEFGANIPSPQSYMIDINMDICQLVFIGKDWKRKGGDKMLEIFKLLKKDSFPCTLTIIGATHQNVSIEDENLIIIPFLDKTIKEDLKEDLKEFCEILSKSHFLVLPTEFDAFGIVFSEASAYALPSITSNVGGVGQAVREGVNGYLLPLDANASDYATIIKTTFSNKRKYIKLRETSRYEYETRLNWNIWGENVNEILEDAVFNWKLQNA